MRSRTYICTLLIVSLTACLLISCHDNPVSIDGNDSNTIWEDWRNPRLFDSYYLSSIWGYCDGSWKSMPSGTIRNLNGVWGSDHDSTFAVGANGAVVQYDGTIWESQQLPGGAHLYDVWGRSGVDVYAVGEYTGIIHYDGVSWEPVTVPQHYGLLGVWGDETGEIFAVGRSGVILHYDGSTWETMTSGTSVDLSGVRGTSSSDVYAAGQQGIVLHYDGSEWSQILELNDYAICTDILCLAPDDIYVAGINYKESIPPAGGIILHYDGSNWSTTPAGVFAALTGIWGDDADHIFVVGNNGTILARKEIYR